MTARWSAAGCFSVEEIRRLRAGGRRRRRPRQLRRCRRRLAGLARRRAGSLASGWPSCSAIETVVVVVSEAEKPFAILGVLRTGVVDVLVVDEGNARFLAEQARGTRAASRKRRCEVPVVPTQEILEAGVRRSATAWRRSTSSTT